MLDAPSVVLVALVVAFTSLERWSAYNSKVAVCKFSRTARQAPHFVCAARQLTCKQAVASLQ